jgi:CHAD domain-containing protein
VEQRDVVGAGEPSAGGPAAVVVLAQLRAQVAELESHDDGVRRDAPDAVHRMRVASRRLRSALASFRPLLDRGTLEDLRAQLKWLADLLGEARDAEVMRDRLAAMTADPAPGGDEALPDSVGARLDATYHGAHARVVEALDSPHYARLLDALDRLVASPPWAPAAELPARDVLPARARREWKRLKARVTAADEATDEHERDVELHEVRKAAKRLRYACEALVPAFGPPAAETAAAAERLQEVLGDYQDSIVSQGRLRELATREDASEDAFVLGRLHRLEQDLAERSREEYGDAWAELSRKRLRRWMTAGRHDHRS